jgi:hypothetical protein
VSASGPLGDPSGDQLTRLGNGCPSKSHAFRVCVLLFAPVAVLWPREPSAAPRRRSPSTPAPPPAGCPRPPSARPEGRARSRAQPPAAGERWEPCKRARPLWAPWAASHSPSLPGHKAGSACLAPDGEARAHGAARQALRGSQAAIGTLGDGLGRANLGRGEGASQPLSQGAVSTTFSCSTPAAPPVPIVRPARLATSGSGSLGLPGAPTFCCRRAMSVGCLALKG